ncbi:hypothetical protein EG329_005615 [Mollisiaceae sp. DMI_Dod_QoI]|nr:hypothetical protein EG329_005615 [Helotiales sp. DMI_Dod_QoI]
MPTELCFELFPKLPTELKLAIWEHTLEPRYVYLDIHDTGSHVIFSRGRPTKAVPSVLRVHKESRDLLLHRYPALFCGNYLKHGRGVHRQPELGGVRFNPALDILVIDELGLENAVEYERTRSFSIFALSALEEDLATIRYITPTPHFSYAVHSVDFKETFPRLRGLKSVLVMGIMVDDLTSFPIEKKLLPPLVEASLCKLEQRCQGWKAPKVRIIKREDLDEGLRIFEERFE